MGCDNLTIKPNTVTTPPEYVGAVLDNCSCTTSTTTTTTEIPS